MFQTKVVEEIRAHILCPITFPARKCIVYVKMWKHIVERCRPRMTIWRVRFACWTTKAIITPSEYVVLIAFTRQK